MSNFRVNDIGVARGIIYLAGLLLASLSLATVEFELPHLVGIYEQGHIETEIPIPRFQEITGAAIELSGSHVLGIQGSCSPPYSYPAGADIFIEFRFDEYIWARGYGRLPAVEGPFHYEFPIWPNPDLPVWVFFIGGLIPMEFIIGRVGGYLICNDYLVLPISQIDAAYLVIEGVVPTERTSWGAVKNLYR